MISHDDDDDDDDVNNTFNRKSSSNKIIQTHILGGACWKDRRRKSLSSDALNINHLLVGVHTDNLQVHHIN